MKLLLLLLVTMGFCCTTAGQVRTDTTFIYFSFGSPSLTAASKTALHQFVAGYHQKVQETPLTINGFCDTIGSLSYNDRLSERRVAAVQTFLLEQGISPVAITTTKAYGKRVPINTNSTPEERQLNRRVEIIRALPALAPTAPTAPSPQPELEKTDTAPVFSKILLDSLKEGQTIRLRHINFYGGRHTFLPQSRPALEELLSVMQSYPNLVIEIQGHICCLYTGYDADDFDSGDNHLSRNRAKAVYDFLRENGISKNRLSYSGFAGSQPLVYPERSETERTLNRRVEIRIVRK